MSNYDYGEEQIINSERYDDYFYGYRIEEQISISRDRPLILHFLRGFLTRYYGSAYSYRLSDNTNKKMENYKCSDIICTVSPYCAIKDSIHKNVHIVNDCNDYNTSHQTVSSWVSAYRELKEEFKKCCRNSINLIYGDKNKKPYEKLLLTCELPFLILRKITVPIPCGEYYNRALIALSVVLAPIWLGIYLIVEFDANYFYFVGDGSFFNIELLCILCLIFGVFIMRFAPSFGNNVPLTLSIPIALLGFFVAATWIDAIANQLVSLLTYLGVILRIPKSIMGITILAWGNSMGDLSANVTMARKGLSNMAMTACFAGPVFNFLFGLGCGFAALEKQTDVYEKFVEITPSIYVGFFFLTCNCIIILANRLIMNMDSISSRYCYIAFTLYFMYIILSIVLQCT